MNIRSTMILSILDTGTGDLPKTPDEVKVRISVTKEKDIQPVERDYILTDDDGSPIALAGKSTGKLSETERIQVLYPGQPENEDTSDETMPAASDFLGPGSSDIGISDQKKFI